MTKLIKQGYLVDPSQNVSKVCNIVITDDKVTGISDEIPEGNFDEVIEAKGFYVFPGFIDLHVHFREPGLEYKETIETGSRAAAAGGFTTVCMMPNTKPAIDTPERVKWAMERAKETAVINVLPIGAITLGQSGTELCDIKGMKAAGACAISEDGKSVMDENLMREAMKIAKEVDIPIFDHCEDINMVKGGVMNAGRRAKELGLLGITNEVENSIEARDLQLAYETGAQIHLCHCSTFESTGILMEYKEKGARATGETGPHYIALSEDDIPGDDANFKMNPPLRAEKDRVRLQEAVTNGEMDVIATDHAPHSAEEKKNGFMGSPFGIVGLETSFPVCYSVLCVNGDMTIAQLVDSMSCKPARILHSDRGTLKVGAVADLTIFDLDSVIAVDPSNFKSKGVNTPFAGKKLYGKHILTICGGKTV